MSIKYPGEVLGVRTHGMAAVIHDELNRIAADHSIHALYALALVLSWRLQRLPMADRRTLHALLTTFTRVNALGLPQDQH